VYIRELRVQDLRIIESVELEPYNGINLFVGLNGAGKTTLLEAIHLLGHGRSFRHTDSGPLVRRGREAAQVVALLENRAGRKLRIGVRRAKGHFQARCNGAEIHRRSELMRRVPIQLLTPASHELVEKGPELRRRFLDQGLFHVEHDYHRLVGDYVRAMKQRNAALRDGESRLAATFEGVLASSGTAIQQLRARYLQSLQDRVGRCLEELGADFDVRLELRSGWGGGELEVALKAQRARDLKLGFTSVGPHRAEVKMSSGERAASRMLSRGQQKLLVYALGFAQLELIEEVGGEQPLLLVDDLGAELDRQRVDAVLRWLLEREIQVFVASLEAPVTGLEAVRVFHVEQGRVNLS